MSGRPRRPVVAGLLAPLVVAVLVTPPADVWAACPISTRDQCRTTTPATTLAACQSPSPTATCVVSRWDPTPAPGLTCDFRWSREVETVLLPTLGFRCCSDTAP